MVEQNMTRKKIGLLLTGDYTWAGGLYYVLNIIQSLCLLDEKTKPEIVIFYSDRTPKEVLNEIDYPFATLVNLNKYNLFYRAFYKIYRIVSNRNLQLQHIINPYNLNALYPISEYFLDLKLNCSIVYWIYDLQHKYMPEIFSKEEIDRRNQQFQNISKYAEKIVFSSYDSMNSFRKFYPDTKASLHVLQFVSVIAQNNISDFDTIKIKYKITRPCFIVANQFWQHKNHIIVLKALSLLKKISPDVLVVFTGKQDDYRNRYYFDSLINFAKQESLERNILFTGFIHREDQLCLIKNSVAVIQPSKFEGWSTVVEDAKALNKLVIASDINVHREQLGSSEYFFPQDNHERLAEIMSRVIANREFFNNIDYNYLYRIRQSASNFVNLF